MRCQAWTGPSSHMTRCSREATVVATSMYSYDLCERHARLLRRHSRIATTIERRPKGDPVKQSARMQKVMDAKTKTERARQVEELAQLLHESGRKAVERGKVINNLGKPFLGWNDISEDAREGRRIMARFLLDLRRRSKLRWVFS